MQSCGLKHANKNRQKYLATCSEAWTKPERRNCPDSIETALYAGREQRDDLTNLFMVAKNVRMKCHGTQTHKTHL